MATALVTQIAYAVQSLFDPAGTAGRLIDLGKLANYGLLTSFTPAYLFTNGVNGAWYDPSDINLTWRRNLLTYSEQFDNAAWTKNTATVTPNAVAAPDGTISSDLISSTIGYSGFATQSVAVNSGSSLTYSFYIRKTTQTTNGLFGGFSVEFRTSTSAIAEYGAAIDSDSGALIPAFGWGSGFFTNHSVSSEGEYWKIVATTPAAPNSTVIAHVYHGVAGYYLNGSRQVTGSSSKILWGAQLELGSTATAYQRITDGIKDYLDYNPLPILYQDAAGTTPCTAVEQPVGLMLDKSKGLVLGPELVTNGDFSNGTTGWILVNTTVSSGQLLFSGAVGSTATQSGVFSSGKNYKFTLEISRTTGTLYVLAGGNVVLTRLVSGAVSFIATGVSAGNLQILSNDFVGTIDNISVRELPGNHAFNGSGNSANFPVLSARYNLLTKSEDFSDAVWLKENAVVVTNVIAAPDSTVTADKLTENSASAWHNVYQVYAYTAATHTFSVYAKAGERNWLWINTFWGTCYYNLATGTVGTIAGGGVTAAIRAVGNGWYQCLITYTATAITKNVYMSPSVNGSDGGTYTGDGTSGIYIWGADLRVANDTLGQPAYQRVNTSTDYDTVGFKPYLRFNGTNQWLQTNSIDFSYGDKMFVSAGVRKLSDAASGHLVELSVTIDSNNGSFVLAAPSTPNHYVWGNKGTISKFAIVSSGNAAPITNVLSGIGNISGDQAILRANGTQVASASLGQGTGNYGNYPLFIGARAGTSLWFNGRLYSLVVAGKQASAAEIASTEAFLNQKTQAYTA